MIKYFGHQILNFLFIVSVFSLVWSCKSNQIAKTETKAKHLAVLETLYAQNHYRIDIQVAYPFTSTATTQVANTLLRYTGDTPNRVDLRGDGNFLEIKNDSVKGYLPFFGEQRLSAGSYGGQNLAIHFEEPTKELIKKINTNKAKLELDFSASQKGTDNDRYDITIEIYANKNVRVNITPVNRTFIRYDGRLEIDDKE